MIGTMGMATKWCRVRTPDGPSFGMVEGETIALVSGTPFDQPVKSGTTIPLSSAQLLVPVIPGTFYAIGSNYRDHIEKMAAGGGTQTDLLRPSACRLSGQQRIDRARRGHREAGGRDRRVSVRSRAGGCHRQAWTQPDARAGAAS